MGLFLSITSVVGKSKHQVKQSLENYLSTVSGGLEVISDKRDIYNYCIIQEENNNTSILYPTHFIEWDKISEFISNELQAPVFSFHIHDGDLWMYLFFQNGKLINQFNTVPSYWEGEMTYEELQQWAGDAEMISNLLPTIHSSEIKKYFKFWDLENEIKEKAYPTDEFTYGDCWQLVDFMKKLKLPFPINEDDEPLGETFVLWTKEFKKIKFNNSATNNHKAKAWWKFW